jgi:hypothetical protein
MKISDLLSPTDVMIDVRASNKRVLLQDLAARAASSLSLSAEQVAPYLLPPGRTGTTPMAIRRQTLPPEFSAWIAIRSRDPASLSGIR